jgi:hypothetical protein
MRIVEEYRIKISEVEERDLRQFGFLFGAIALVFVGFLLPWWNPIIPKWKYAYLSFPFLFCAMIYPKALLPVFKVATVMGLVLGKINNFVLLTLLFWIIFTPYSFFIRIFTKKLGSRFSNAVERDSFKVYRNDEITAEQLEKPF